MTPALQSILNYCSAQCYVFTLPANLLETADRPLIDSGLLVPSDTLISHVVAPCGCAQMLEVQSNGSASFVLCPDCGQLLPLNRADLLQYAFDVLKVRDWFALVQQSLPPAERNQIIVALSSLLAPGEPAVAPTKRPASAKPRKHQLISLKEASKITEYTVSQLRTLEAKPNVDRDGYPGRDGKNREFVEFALREWAKQHRSRMAAEKSNRKAIKNPLHRIPS